MRAAVESGMSTIPKLIKIWVKDPSGKPVFWRFEINQFKN